MRRRRGGWSGLSIGLLAFVLLACSLSGLAAGVFANQLAHGGSRIDLGLSGSQSTASASQSATKPTSTSAATATSVPTIVAQPGFTLKLTATPNVLKAGADFTATVVATSASGSPVVGLTCYLRAPEGNSRLAPLYDQWPPAAVTDTSGTAAWHLKAPQTNSGTYGIEVVAYGTNNYQYSWLVHVTIIS